MVDNNVSVQAKETCSGFCAPVVVVWRATVVHRPIPKRTADSLNEHGPVFPGNGVFPFPGAKAWIFSAEFFGMDEKDIMREEGLQ